jgi:Bacterial SH3 domain/WD40-like Beta Propeller Repeat
MNIHKFALFPILLGAVLFAACAASPTATPTLAPPSPTPIPTDTAVPSRTPLPATPTVELPTPTPAPPTATQIPPVATAKIIINVHAGPGAAYPVIGKLKKGEKKAIIGKSEDSMWWQIQFDSQAGWIPADFTEWQGATNLVAVISVAPPPTPTEIPTQTGAPLGSTPLPTPTVQIPPPGGRIYFVVQQHTNWLRPGDKNQVFPSVTIGAPADMSDLNISSNASPLDWSAAAGKLAFVFNNGPQDKLETVDSNSNVTVLASHGAIITPRWFADGQEIAFVGYDNGSSSQKIYIVNPADGREIRVCPGRSGEQLRGLAVSPKTGDIAFVSNYSGTFEIWKMDSSCSGVVQLTKDNADDSAPAFSRDGSKIAYISNKTAPTDNRIYVMGANGGDALPLGLGDSRAPAFSPDGFWIAFEHNLEVYIMDAYGASVEPLAPGGRPAWAP